MTHVFKKEIYTLLTTLGMTSASPSHSLCDEPQPISQVWSWGCPAPSYFQAWNFQGEQELLFMCSEDLEAQGNTVKLLPCCWGWWIISDLLLCFRGTQNTSETCIISETRSWPFPTGCGARPHSAFNIWGTFLLKNNSQKSPPFLRFYICLISDTWE